jgi:2-amino-4-hydroxy-6-hydroxymethyldihydropteridine diphosphokinase
MATCLIALGANLGDRRAALDWAVGRLREHTEIHAVTLSDWVATQPVGGPDGQGGFLNGAVRLETSLGPEALLAVLRETEQRLGRVAGRRWAARVLDLDLLLYDQRVIDTPALIVPHPRMSFRRFVLVPAVQIARDMIHPTIGWTLGDLLNHLDTAAAFVAIAGPPGAGKTWLAERLSTRFQGRLICQSAVPPGAEESTADWGGPAYATEIKFLRGRIAILAAERWSKQTPADRSAATVVSDFWFDQGLAYASCHLSGELLDRFRAEWDCGRRQVVRPKLLVILDAPAERPGDQGSRQPAAAPLQLRRAILDHARQQGHGPTLWLAGRRRDECLVEAVAAVEAMHSGSSVE